MKQRRHDLDWLRVLVFGLLIFYHVGMFFVPWGWHIKNPITYDGLRIPMLILNQWRIPILFVISGMGTYFALSKRTGKQYRKERLVRLCIPLAVGILLIVPPQVYIERWVHGQFEGSYWQFLTTKAFVGIYPTGNFSWHHLWFLPYLLIFSLLCSPLFVYLRNHPQTPFLSWARKLVSRTYGLYAFILPLAVVTASLGPFFPITHALVGDWYALAYFLVLFFYGFLLMALGPTFWTAVDRLKRPALLIAVLTFLPKIWLWTQVEETFVVEALQALLRIVYMWSVFLVLFGYGAKYLNRPSRTLTYLNESVYPLYIFHQTITILIGYTLLSVSLSFVAKFSLMILGTFGGSFILFELTRRINVLRPLFGMKGKYKGVASRPTSTDHLVPFSK